MSFLVPHTQKICKYFPLHPSRKETLVSLILGAMSSGNVHHQSLARYVNSPHPRSAQRRVERFFLRKHYPSTIMPEVL